MNSTVPADRYSTARPSSTAASCRRARACVGEAGRRRFLDDLLVAPLQRAVALAERDHAARPSPKICTSTWRASRDEALEETPPSPKLCARRPLHAVEARAQLGGIAAERMPMPPPPAVLLSITG